MIDSRSFSCIQFCAESREESCHTCCFCVGSSLTKQADRIQCLTGKPALLSALSRSSLKVSKGSTLKGFLAHVGLEGYGFIIGFRKSNGPLQNIRVGIKPMHLKSKPQTFSLTTGPFGYSAAVCAEYCETIDDLPLQKRIQPLCP